VLNTIVKTRGNALPPPPPPIFLSSGQGVLDEGWKGTVSEGEGLTSNVPFPLVCGKLCGGRSRALEACLVGLHHAAEQPGDAGEDVDALQVHQRYPQPRNPQHLQGK